MDRLNPHGRSGGDRGHGPSRVVEAEGVLPGGLGAAIQNSPRASPREGDLGVGGNNNVLGGDDKNKNKPQQKGRTGRTNLLHNKKTDADRENKLMSPSPTSKNKDAIGRPSPREVEVDVQHGMRANSKERAGDGAGAGSGSGPPQMVLINGEQREIRNSTLVDV